jgi:formate hydrogenlyase transcriptional activator
MGNSKSPDAGGGEGWRYQVLLEVADLIGLHTDIERLLPDLAECLKRVVAFDSCGILLPTESGAETTVYAIGFDRGDGTLGTNVDVRTVPSITDTPMAALWASQSTAVVSELVNDERFAAMAPYMHPHLSACWLPLTTSLRPVGILGFASTDPGAYEHVDLAFLRRVASIVAVAIDNVRNHELAAAYHRRLEADRDHWRTLLEVNNEVVRRLDLHTLLSSIAPNLRRIVPHDFTFLGLLDRDGDHVRLFAVDPPVPQAVSDAMRSIEVAQTPFAKALASRKPFLIEPAEIVDLPPALALSEQVLATRSVCLAPLPTSQGVIGALVLASNAPNAFAQEDLEGVAQAAGQIAIAIENALAYGEIAALKDRLTLENLYLEDEVRGKAEFEEIIGNSKALQRVLAQARSVAATDSTVLLLGETGTGKELVARAIHQLSARHSRTLVTVNCAAAPAGLLESEWFGYERGAFTGALAQKVGRFELAHMGSLFLDEVGDIPLELQAKLLRALQEHEIERLGSTRTIPVDFRLIAATNRNLEEMVANREYRSDLFYRLNVFPIRIPPLRERRDDIPPLVQYFTQSYARRLKRHIESIPRDAMDVLCQWSWPGNVRELQNVIERAVILSNGPSLQLPLSEFKPHAAMEAAGSAQTLEANEREHILRTLTETDWVIGGPHGAAVKLGVKRTTLVSTMRRLGIVRPRPGR